MIEAYIQCVLLLGISSMLLVAFNGSYKISDENFYLGAFILSIVSAFAFYLNFNDSNKPFYFYYFIPFFLGAICLMAIIKLQDRKLFYPFLVLLVATLFIFSKTYTPVVARGVTIAILCIEIYYFDKINKQDRNKRDEILGD